MTEIVLLDAGPLGMISHPRPSSEIAAWLARMVASGVLVIIPEIADYEVRRELLRAGRTKGVDRLDQLKNSLGFLPITTEAMLRAAQLWAEVRRRGRPTAHDRTLDADVILAGQTTTLHGNNITVATTNVRHLNRLVRARHWQKIGMGNT